MALGTLRVQKLLSYVRLRRRFAFGLCYDLLC
jgi:hypothetical protein